ncbi:MAG: hypothetical protein GY898_13000 [Proteobacteria bacterium]|nr:hypothetical protein [Pseudomonadota bacterium]
MVHPRNDDFAMLTRVPQRALGQPIVDLLLDHEIKAWIQSDDCGGVDPALNFVNGTHVMVPRAKLARSQELLAEFQAAAPLMPGDDGFE